MNTTNTFYLSDIDYFIVNQVCREKCFSIVNIINVTVKQWC